MSPDLERQSPHWAGSGNSMRLGGRLDFSTGQHPQRDPAWDFAEAARQRGLVIDTVAGDGLLHRVHVEGDKHGSRNGWYTLFLDNVPAGAFGSWKGDWRESWHASGSSGMTPAERIRLNNALAEAKCRRDAETLQRWQVARDAAQAVWQSAASAHRAHAYLVRKQVQAHGIRQLNSLLLIPMRDADGVLWNLQSIDADGVKLFRKGARKTGTYHPIGGAVIDVLHIAEGYATAASVHEVTRQPVAVAFDCGNLDPVARVLRAKYPHARITICADNDANTTGNPGLTKARAAAAAIGGLVAIPPDPYNDFNDAACGVSP